MASLYDFDRDGLAALLEGEPRFRTDQLWRGLWVEGRALADITTVPAGLRASLASRFPSTLTARADVSSDHGSTRKWVFELADGATIETVLMVYDDRVTVCVSSQAGCAMGCTFCATGQAGFTRQLTVGEVVEQVLYATRAAAPRRLSNVVFMGMGEPLANYRVTVEVVRRLHDARGLSARHLTISTVGVVPGIRRLAAEPLQVNLAVSLHAANDRLRNDLVPLGRRYPIAALMDACADYVAATHRRVSFEWALIRSVNDRDADADELARLARALGAHVNLIPLNPVAGRGLEPSPPQAMAAFQRILREGGVAATLRRQLGTAIDAACGQLAAVTNAKRSVAIRSRRVAPEGRSPAHQ